MKKLNNLTTKKMEKINELKTHTPDAIHQITIKMSEIIYYKSRDAKIENKHLEAYALANLVVTYYKGREVKPYYYKTFEIIINNLTKMLGTLFMSELKYQSVQAFEWYRFND